MAEEDGGKLNPIDKLKCMSERQFANLLREFWDFSLYHGNMMKIHTNPVTEPHKAHTSNTSLVPTVFSKQAYYNSISIQKIYNMLYHKVATDSDFLRSSLDSVSKHDDFMKRHLDMLERLEKDNITPRIYLALNRNDYMCHHEWSVLKQVEFNTMSSAASGVCRAATKWHRYVTGVLMGLDEQTHIPENKATAMLAQAMVRAWELYDNESAAVVFFCTQSEFNFADQRSLQYDIHKCNPKISVMRVTFEDLFTNMKLDSERRLFIYDREVAIVYYRWGYAPHQYMTEKHWNVRYDIERSLAVKCPSLSYVLAGTKRIQQVLAQPGVIEKWLSAEQCILIRQTFIGLHSFEPSECGEKSVDLAQNNPSGYVMKPQRDGGGNNSYNEAIVDKLNTLTREELSAYTLMEKIEPPSSENYIVCEEKLPKLKSVLNELGIFGALVACDGEVVMNEGEGFLLRSKDTSVLEGGLMRGSSCLDSPWLV